MTIAEGMKTNKKSNDPQPVHPKTTIKPFKEHSPHECWPTVAHTTLKKKTPVQLEITTMAVALCQLLRVHGALDEDMYLNKNKPNLPGWDQN